MPKRSTNKNSRGRATKTSRPEYELHIRGGINTTDDLIEAELRSPALDPIVHPMGSLRVDINTDITKRPKLSAILDTFHVESLLEYLRGQPRLRKTLEQALKRDQAEWDPGGPKLTPDDTWSRAKIDSLQLRRRQEITPELEAHLKHTLPPNIAKMELAARGDDAATRTVFTIVLECDWDDEHTVRANFRDGALVDLDHQ